MSLIYVKHSTFKSETFLAYVDIWTLTLAIILCVLLCYPDWIMEIHFSLVLQMLIYKGFNAFRTRAIRLIFGLKRRDHITSHLTELHWLPVKECVYFKLLTMFLCLHGCAPNYLQDDINLYSSVNTGHHLLRSSQDNTRLFIPSTTRRAGDNSFHVYGPRLWNTLPRNIREAPTLSSFKKAIKTYLFSSV